MVTEADDVRALNRLCIRHADRPPPLPNFIGVGPGRCGTSSLYAYLKSHPDVFMSEIKEINFFGHRTFAALGADRGLHPSTYRMYFSGHNGEKMIGEISPIYLSQAGAAGQIFKTLGPDCKIIASIRQPIDRFLSQFLAASPFIVPISAEDYVAAALRDFSDRSHRSAWHRPDRNLRHSLYGSDLRRYLDLFGRNQVLVIEFDWFKEPDRLAAKLCTFLGVELSPQGMWASNHANGDATISAASRARLRSFFEADMEATERLTGYDLSHWHA